MKKLLLLALLLTICFGAGAKNWLVGASRTYKVPSAVAGMVADNDTVSIDSGTYTADVARWAANNLLLRGMGGFAYLQSNGANYGGKAIWVIDGTNTTVEWIEFSGCVVTDNNGAGIRQEAANLTVRHCYFHDNQEGILAGTVANSKILIEFTEFSHNGAGDGYSHNLYINNIDTLVFRFNYTHLASVGHELKSRAHVNYILYNRFGDESTGTASRDIDLPNGGQTIIIGNLIEKGPQAQNNNVLEFGLEGLSNPAPHELYLINNTIVSDRSTTLFIDLASGTSLYKAYNNIFVGNGSLLAGTATIVDTSHNWVTSNIATVNFANAANYDYHLLSSSPAINAGTNAGVSNGGFSLMPLFEYKKELDSVSRAVSGVLDMGAREYASPLRFNEEKVILPAVSFYNFNRMLYISSQKNVTVSLFDALGKFITAKSFFSGTKTINLHELPAGIYFVQCYSENKYSTGKIVLQ